jgi:dTMP kinase
MQDRGVFITLEGIDFSGKSTQAEMLIRRLRQCSCDSILLREPGGTALSERVREILLNHGHIRIVDRAELLLFLAARAQLVDEVIAPAVESGRVVVCDRFYDSTYAYQGFARGLPLSIVTEMNSFAVRGVVPDLTLLFDLPVETAQRRRRGALSAQDRLEKERLEFHGKVREGYLDLARREPDRIQTVDASRDRAGVFDRTWELVSRLLTERGVDASEKS